MSKKILPEVTLSLTQKALLPNWSDLFNSSVEKIPTKKKSALKIFIAKDKRLILFLKYRAEKKDAAKIILTKSGTCTTGTAVCSARSAKNEIRKEAGAMVKSAILSINTAATSENGTRNCARVTKGTESETTGITKKFTNGERTENVPESAALTTRRIQLMVADTQIKEIAKDFGKSLQSFSTVATHNALIKKLIEIELPGISSATAAREQKKMKTGWGNEPKIIKKSKKRMNVSERRVGIEAPVMKK